MKKFNKLLLLLGVLGLAQAGQAAIINYGAGNISDTVNTAGWKCVVDYGNWIYNAGVVKPGVSSCNPIGAPTPIYPQKVAPATTKPTMTHRWWGSVSFMGEMRIGATTDSAYITPDPITARITERGVRLLGIPGGLRVNGNEYTYPIPDPFSEVFDGIAVGNSSYNNLDAFLKDYSDGSVTVQWRSGSTAVMEATFVHGSPYVYFTALQGNLVVRTKAGDGGEKGVFYQSGNHLGVWTDVAGNRNAFLITGHDATTFTGVNTNSIGVNNGTKRMTVTWLPQLTGTPSTAMINAFAQYATQQVDRVNINYSVNRTTNMVTVSHQYQFNGANVTTMTGLLPMHWKNSNQAVTSYKVRSARGVTKFATTSNFSYTIPYVGVLPYFPEAIGDYNNTQLRALVTEFVNQGTANWNGATDTYWAGKNYGKVAELAAIARSIGMTAEANQMIAWLKAELQDWFRANTTGALDTSKYFVYDNNWNTLLGFDESFGAQQQLNDHHFHYGYFVRAAAEICRVDANWCSSSQYGPMVELLIRDYAAGRDDAMFPYLRNFDPAYGFSWASGHANFVLGNNNESTSEAANAYGAMVLYGMITGNNAITERGMYLHASSTEAYWEYWNNIDRYRGLGGDYDNFPAAYTRPTTSIIWGNGHVFSTWFSGAYAHILGIQGLPLSPLVLHIGQHADYLNNYVALGLSESSNGKPSGLVNDQWRDVWWNIWAMTNGQAAVDDLLSYGFNYVPEAGETKAHTYHWVYTLKQLGHLATGTGALTANHPAAVAFNKNGILTYIAYNFGCSAINVAYSDGTSMSVPAKGYAYKRTGQSTVSSGAGCGGSSSSSSTSSSLPGNAVTLFNHIDYGGWSASFPVGSYNYNALIAAGAVNDQTTSVRVPAGYKVTLYEHGDFTGTSVTLTADSNYLGSFNDKTSSLVVSLNTSSSSSSSSSSVASAPYGHSITGGSSVRFHANNAAWADIHYTVNNGAQQNIRMTHNADNSNTFDLTGIPAGATVRYFFTIAQGAGAYDTDWLQFNCCSGGGSSTPASSSSSSAPAFSLLVQAEAFTAMSGVQTEATTDTGGGQNVSYIDTGDWMAYADITIPATGSYRIEYRVASPAGAALSADLNAGAIQLGNVAVPATGGWQTWTTVNHTVTLNAGTYAFGIFAQQSGWNINWFRITRL
ncbi:glucan endo-1,3-beta-glucanase, putative, glu81A [Cellvibrio japonicus Ueda107]|uniref:glucan endo-1,3-beta-D-glucosidase n=2 Tax=Cellvibrio japonicus TaxID=155077 RepID=B3PGF9_CELJU|nr:glycosyl hydrolase [Cellvibrio japonicus]ACE83197.1 glucan endo-1,3-beta-glucanase, putative, glu81A [Cellvibrio japonicus Ueda107]